VFAASGRPMVTVRSFYAVYCF